MSSAYMEHQLSKRSFLQLAADSPQLKYGSSVQLRNNLRMEAAERITMGSVEINKPLHPSS